MVWITNSVLFLLTIFSAHGQDALSVRILDLDGKNDGGDLNLVYEKEEVVVCEITNSDTNPVVTFGFENVDKFPEINDVATISQFVDNKYNVNVTITFNVTGDMNGENLICRFDDQEWKARLELYFPPLLLIYGSSGIPTTVDNEYKLHCDSISVPETSVKWKVDGIPLEDSALQYTEDQACKQVYNTNYESNSYKYECGSNLTVTNIRKQDIGSNITCDYIYEGEVTKSGRVATLDLQYPPEKITVDAKPTKSLDSVSNGTVELTCTTTASNPEASLYWYRGDETKFDRIDVSQYPFTTTKAMYNGKVVSQTISISVDKAMNGKSYVCCTGTFWFLASDVCGSSLVQVPWLTEIMAPQLDEYTFHVGSNASIPCIVDSNPVSSLAWFKSDGNSDMEILNNANQSNTLELEITNIKQSDAGNYHCKAILYVDDVDGHMGMLSKTIAINVVEIPEKPSVHIADSSQTSPIIVIETATTAPEVPRSLYLQYKKSSNSVWLEISHAYRDTRPGEGSVRYEFDMSSLDLQPGEYNVRIKTLSHNGLVSYTDAQNFQVKKADDDEDMVEKSDYNTAIVVSVLVTAAVFIIIIIVVVCLLKRGACSSSGGSNSWNVS